MNYKEMYNDVVEENENLKKKLQMFRDAFRYDSQIRRSLEQEIKTLKEENEMLTQVRDGLVATYVREHGSQEV